MSSETEWESQIRKYGDEASDQRIRMLLALEEIEKTHAEILKKSWPRILMVGETFARTVGKRLADIEKDYFKIGYEGPKVTLETGFSDDGSITSRILIEYYYGWSSLEGVIPIDEFNEALFAKKLIEVYEGKINEKKKELTKPYIQYWERKEIKRMIRKRR